MSEVKWIKITTDIFNDEKMLLIESMPDSDSIIVIWFKLLSLAGKSNNGGLIMMSDKIPYTKDMLPILFRRKVTVVELALHTFVQFGMIEILDNDTILVSNWGKHQNIKGLDDIREQNKIRQQKYRDNQKKLLLENKDKKQKDEELDKEEDIDIEGNATNNVTVNYKLVKKVWNDLNLSQVIKLTDKRKKHINARIDDYGFDKFIGGIKSIKDSKFLMESKNTNWLNFDWLVNPNNFVKLVEGKYHKEFKNYNTIGKNLLPQDIESDWLDEYIAKTKES